MRRSYFSEASVVEAIRKFNELYGRPPVKLEWHPADARARGHVEMADRFVREGCWPSFKVVRRLFGSWNAAILAAGFEPLKHRRPLRWPRDEIVSALVEFSRLDPDAIPSKSAFARWGHGPSLTVISRAGSWEGLLRDAERFLPFSWPELPSAPPMAMAEKTLRHRAFDIFDRDGFRCSYCGRSPRGHGVVLHVDHVVPVSRGGSNALENLTTACAECNSEKSDRPLSRLPEGLVGSSARWVPKTKYPDEMVLEMLRLQRDGLTHREIAEQFDLTKEKVRDLLRSRSVVRQAKAAV